MTKNTLSLVAGGAAAVLLTGCQLAPSSMGSAAPGDTVKEISLGERVRGELTTQSGLNRKDGSRYQTFAMTLSADTLLEIDLEGSLDGVLTLYNEQDELLAVASPLRYKVTEPGDYKVVVSGIDESSYGPFNVVSRTIDLELVSSLTAPGSASGWLQGEPVEFTVTIPESGAYQIDMRSDDFDALMVMTGPNGYEVENDDGGEEYNARIGDILNAGEYRIQAGSYEQNAGLFTIEVSSLNVDIDEEREISAPADIAGWMRNGPDVYTLTIEQEGVYQIDMRSDGLDPMLTLEGPAGYVAEDDDGGDNYNARLTERLAPGVYTLTARCYEENRGLYSLTVAPL
ncbi:MAG: hypothetical protein R3175_05015 [Marinobacter sp.]|uniref:hypothetical protein n=1 Tax=Marinobacter sp. TaxID=50741 RepID=UPI00299D5A85|nr:hypothetical protein [Marinobacter sp.]MDX1755404.1 hypothetical protein [Marinobacter sp.]